jgi:hypothetical protein
MTYTGWDMSLLCVSTSIKETTEIVLLPTKHNFPVRISWMTLMKTYTQIGINRLSKLIFMHLQETRQINSSNHTNVVLTLTLSYFSTKVTCDTPQTNTYMIVHLMTRVNTFRPNGVYILRGLSSHQFGAL